MKQSATAGCISSLSGMQRERKWMQQSNNCNSAKSTPNEPLASNFNVRTESNGRIMHKPIIRNSASSYTLGRNSVRFVEQPPVCRVEALKNDSRPVSLALSSIIASAADTASDSTSNSSFERTFERLMQRASDGDSSLQLHLNGFFSAGNGQSKPRASESRKDRSRLRLDLPVQLSKMALSTMNTMNGGGIGIGNGLSNGIMSRSFSGVCVNCGRGFEADEPATNVNGTLWHAACFTCAQCFRPFKDGIFYEFDGRKYCEDDFNTLFAPCCKRCDAFITGRVIKAMNCNWHPQCFCCEECSRCLADEGFVKNAGRALCRDCNVNAKASSKVRHVCFRCHAEVEDSALLRFKGEVYHAYHFKCRSCGVECNTDAREKEGEMFCLRCYDKMGVKICAACRRPIDERVVNAMGRTWHVEHFVCAKCEKPFLGSQHYEKKGHAYCTTHYLMLFGNVCFYCEQVISSEVVAALSKNWCPDHFACSVCDKKMGPKSKFYDFDLKPVCKSCYDKFPTELQKRLKKMTEKK